MGWESLSLQDCCEDSARMDLKKVQQGPHSGQLVHGSLSGKGRGYVRKGRAGTVHFSRGWEMAISSTGEDCGATVGLAYVHLS